MLNLKNQTITPQISSWCLVTLEEGEKPELAKTTDGKIVDISQKDWRAAIQKEIEAHKDVFRAATNAERTEYKGIPIPCRLLLSTKRDGRKKARMVCLGFLAGQSPIDRYAGVADLTTIKTLISLMSILPDWDLLPVDATSAFLQVITTLIQKFYLDIYMNSEILSVKHECAPQSHNVISTFGPSLQHNQNFLTISGGLSRTSTDTPRTKIGSLFRLRDWNHFARHEWFTIIKHWLGNP